MKVYFTWLSRQKALTRLIIIFGSAIFGPYLLSIVTRYIANFCAREINIIGLGILIGSYLIVCGWDPVVLVSKLKSVSGKTQGEDAASSEPPVAQQSGIADLEEELEACAHPKDVDEMEFEDEQLV